MYVDDSQVDLLTMNLRVHDVSRADLNFGTEMPIVRERDFINPHPGDRPDRSAHWSGLPQHPAHL